MPLKCLCLYKVLKMKRHIYLFFAKGTIRFRKAIMCFADKLIPSKYLLFERAQKFWLPYMLRAAIDLNLADLIKDSVLSVDDLAHKSETRPDALYRLMRALSGEGIFKEHKGRRFSNSALSGSLREDNPDNMKLILKHQLYDKNVEILMNLVFTLKNGEPSSHKAFGMRPFEYLKSNPEINDLYNNAMASSTNMLCDTLLMHYSFKRNKKIIDIGGGNGILLARLLKEYNHLQGVLFDLPHVVKTAKEKVEPFNVAERLEIVPGDIFKTIPPVGDIYIMKNVFHAFGDDDCKIILEKVKKVASSGARILIIEMDLGRPNQSRYGKFYDVQMLATMENGKERTHDEYKKLFEEQNVKFVGEIKTISPFSIYEGVL